MFTIRSSSQLFLNNFQQFFDNSQLFVDSFQIFVNNSQLFINNSQLFINNSQLFFNNHHLNIYQHFSVIYAVLLLAYKQIAQINHIHEINLDFQTVVALRNHLQQVASPLIFVLVLFSAENFPSESQQLSRKA